MALKHSPGPWTMDFSIIRSKDRQQIGCVGLWSGNRREESDANATLIAAAPELLDALRNMLSLLGNAEHDRTALEQAAYDLVARVEG